MVISNNNIKNVLSKWKKINTKKKNIRKQYINNIKSGKINAPLVNVVSNTNKINIQTINEKNIINSIQKNRKRVEEEIVTEKIVTEEQPESIILPPEIQSIKDSLTCYIDYLINDFDEYESMGKIFFGIKPDPDPKENIKKMFLGATDNLYRILGVKPTISKGNIKSRFNSKYGNIIEIRAPLESSLSKINYFKKVIAYKILTDPNMSYYYDQYFYNIWLRSNKKNFLKANIEIRDESIGILKEKIKEEIKKEIKNQQNQKNYENIILNETDYGKKSNLLSDLKKNIEELCNKKKKCENEKFLNKYDAVIINLFKLIDLWSQLEIYNCILPKNATVDYVNKCYSNNKDKVKIEFLKNILNKKLDYELQGYFKKYLINFMNYIYNKEFDFKKTYQYNFYFDDLKNAFFYKFGEKTYGLNTLLEKNFFKELGLKTGEDSQEKIESTDPSKKKVRLYNYEPKDFFEKNIMYQVIKDESIRYVYKKVINVYNNTNYNKKLDDLRTKIGKYRENLKIEENTKIIDYINSFINLNETELNSFIDKTMNKVCPEIKNNLEKENCKKIILENLFYLLRDTKKYYAFKYYLPYDYPLKDDGVDKLFENRTFYGIEKNEKESYKTIMKNGQTISDYLSKSFNDLDKSLLLTFDEFAVLNYMNYIGKNEGYEFEKNQYTYKGKPYKRNILYNFYKTIGESMFANLGKNYVPKKQGVLYNNKHFSGFLKIIVDVLKDKNIKYFYAKYLKKTLPPVSISGNYESRYKKIISIYTNVEEKIKETVSKINITGAENFIKNSNKNKNTFKNGIVSLIKGKNINDKIEKTEFIIKLINDLLELYKLKLGLPAIIDSIITYDDYNGKTKFERIFIDTKNVKELKVFKSLFDKKTLIEELLGSLKEQNKKYDNFVTSLNNILQSLSKQNNYYKILNINKSLSSENIKKSIGEKINNLETQIKDLKDNSKNIENFGELENILDKIKNKYTEHYNSIINERIKRKQELSNKIDSYTNNKINKNLANLSYKPNFELNKKLENIGKNLGSINLTGLDNIGTETLRKNEILKKYSNTIKGIKDERSERKTKFISKISNYTNSKIKNNLASFRSETNSELNQKLKNIGNNLYSISLTGIENINTEKTRRNEVLKKYSETIAGIKKDRSNRKQNFKNKINKYNKKNNNFELFNINNDSKIDTLNNSSIRNNLLNNKLQYVNNVSELKEKRNILFRKLNSAKLRLKTYKEIKNKITELSSKNDLSVINNYLISEKQKINSLLNSGKNKLQQYVNELKKKKIPNKKLQEFTNKIKKYKNTKKNFNLFGITNNDNIKNINKIEKFIKNEFNKDLEGLNQKYINNLSPQKKEIFEKLESARNRLKIYKMIKNGITNLSKKNNKKFDYSNLNNLNRYYQSKQTKLSNIYNNEKTKIKKYKNKVRENIEKKIITKKFKNLLSKQNFDKEIIAQLTKNTKNINIITERHQKLIDELKKYETYNKLNKTKYNDLLKRINNVFIKTIMIEKLKKYNNRANNFELFGIGKNDSLNSINEKYESIKNNISNNISGLNQKTLKNLTNKKKTISNKVDSAKNRLKKYKSIKNEIKKLSNKKNYEQKNMDGFVEYENSKKKETNSLSESLKTELNKNFSAAKEKIKTDIEFKKLIKKGKITYNAESSEKLKKQIVYIEKIRQLIENIKIDQKIADTGDAKKILEEQINKLGRQAILQLVKNNKYEQSKTLDLKEQMRLYKELALFAHPDKIDPTNGTQTLTENDKKFLAEIFKKAKPN